MTHRNNQGPNPYRHFAAGTIAASLLGVPALSRADVALTVQQSAGTGQSETNTAAPAPQTFKLFYKGSNSRLEAAGGQVVLYDGKDGTIYTLDPAHKVYYTTLAMQIAEAGDPVPPGMDQRVSADTKLDVRKTDQVATIAGAGARKYTVTGTVKFDRKSPGGYGGGRRGGGRRGGRGGFPGGFPGMPFGAQYGMDGDDGGENGGGRRDRAPLALPQWNISGEVWLADTVKFPDKADLLSAAELAAPSAGPFLQPLADALAKQKGVPVLTKITVTHSQPDSAGADQPATVTATTLTVTDVSGAPLDDKLFETPIDFTLVAAPQDPYVPGALASYSAP